MLSPETKKRYILQILSGERSQSDVARATGCSRQAVSQWIKLYRTEGEGGIRKQRGRPRIERLPEAELRRLKAIVSGQTPGEAGIEGKFSEWSYEAVRRLIIRETGIKLTYRFVAEYLDEWNMPHPMAGQVPPPRKARPTERQEATRPDNAGAPARHRVNEEDSETFSLAEYEAAIAEARKNLKLQEPPAHGKRTGRHARQRSAPTQKKRKQKSRRKRR